MRSNTASDNRRAARRRAILNRYKRRKGCVDCGYKADHRALEFDHVDETKKVKTVASYCYASWVVIKRELEKCVIRCANCHAIRTHKKHYRARLVELADTTVLETVASALRVRVSHRVPQDRISLNARSHGL